MDPDGLEPTLADADKAATQPSAKARRASSGSAGLPSYIGRYRIGSHLGAGGMGVVYEGFDERLNRRIAIKVLRAAKTGERARKRLLREAQSMAQLSHPNVVQVYEVDEFEGQVFVAMEFVEGKTLGEWVREDGRTSDEIIEVHLQAARGLIAAHGRGLVHRDFKPDNVLIADEDRRARVLDFGLARLGTDVELEEEIEEAKLDGYELQDLTATGTLLGTPAYMAPEQFEGLPPTPAADQFAFCVTLWESLCGERPFAGRTVPALVLNVVGEKVREPAKGARLSKPLALVLRRGLKAQPTDRWDSVTSLADEINESYGARRSAKIRNRVLFGVCVACLAWGVAVFRDRLSENRLELGENAEAYAAENREATGEAESGGQKDPAISETPQQRRRVSKARLGARDDIRQAYATALEAFLQPDYPEAVEAVEAGIAEARAAGAGDDPTLAALYVAQAAILFSAEGNAAKTRIDQALRSAVHLNYYVIVDRAIRSEEMARFLGNARVAVGTSPPEPISHAAPAAACGSDLIFDALLGVPDGGQAALYWRKAGSNDFNAVQMSVFSNVASAQLRHAEHGDVDLEYIIAAFDSKNQNVANLGTQDQPLELRQECAAISPAVKISVDGQSGPLIGPDGEPVPVRADPITHSFPQVVCGGDLVFEALLAGDASKAALYWKKAGSAEYIAAHMHVSGSRATLTVPGPKHGSVDLEYLIAAFDSKNQNVANLGTADHPIKLPQDCAAAGFPNSNPAAE
jgi:tRNA A-37 threonylcarbamoyl transferase component Bud32